MGITFSQAPPKVVATTTPSVDIPFPQFPFTGALIVVGVASSNTSTATVTDNQGNTFLVRQEQHSSTGMEATYWLILPAPVPDPDTGLITTPYTVTISMDNLLNSSIIAGAVELYGADQVNPVGVFKAASSGVGGSAASTGNTVNTDANCQAWIAMLGVFGGSLAAIALSTPPTFTDAFKENSTINHPAGTLEYVVGMGLSGIPASAAWTWTGTAASYKTAITTWVQSLTPLPAAFRTNPEQMNIGDTITFAVNAVGTSWVAGVTTFSIDPTSTATATIAAQSVTNAATGSVTINATTGGTIILTDSADSASTDIIVNIPDMTASPSAIPTNVVYSPPTHPGQPITLTGTNTNWQAGVTTFSVTGVAGVVINTQTVTGPTSATLVMSTGPTTGTVTISNNTDVGQASIIIGAGIIVSPLNFTVTRVTCAFELPFLGNGSTAVVTNCQFRLHAGGIWRNHMGSKRGVFGNYVFDVVQVSQSNTGGALPDNLQGFYGGFVLLAPNTQYDMTITIANAGGGGGVFNGTFTTLADPPAIGAPNYYVDSVNGNDSNDGLTLLTAWATFNKAVTVCNAAVTALTVEFEEGYYVVDQNTPVLKNNDPDPTKQTVFYAKNYAVQYQNTVYVSDPLGTPHPWADPEPANVGHRSVISGGRYLAPGGGNWTQQSLVGPATGLTYTNVWKYTGTGLTMDRYDDFNSALVGDSRNDENPTYVGLIGSRATNGLWTTTTAAGWAEAANNNGTYAFGIWRDSAFNTYIRIPGDIDPNTKWIVWGREKSTSYALEVSGKNCRIEGFEFRCMSNSIRFIGAPAGGMVRYNLFSAWAHAIFAQGTTTAGNIGYLLIEGNHFRHWNMSKIAPVGSDGGLVDGVTDGYIPWHVVKGTGVTLNNGLPLKVSVAQGNACFTQYGATLEFCRNTMNGQHDRGPAQASSLGAVAIAKRRYCNMGSVDYANYSTNHQDDGPELGSNSIIGYFNWDNYDSYSLTGESNSGGLGPQYYFYNYRWQTGSLQEPVDHTSKLSAGIGGGTTNKSGLVAIGNYGRCFFYHCTYATSAVAKGTTTGVGAYRYETPAFYPNGGGLSTVFGFANIVSLVTGHACRPQIVTTNGDHYYELQCEWQTLTSVGSSAGFSYLGALYQTLAAYQAASAQGVGDNPVGGQSYVVDLRGQFTDFPNGDLSIPTRNGWIENGACIGNISDEGLILPAGVHPLDGGGGIVHGQTKPNMGAWQGVTPPTGITIIGGQRRVRIINE